MAEELASAPCSLEFVVATRLRRRQLDDLASDPDLPVLRTARGRPQHSQLLDQTVHDMALDPARQILFSYLRVFLSAC